MNLDAIYTQMITENSRSQKNRHEVESATFTERGHNPSCGDDITLSVRITDGVLDDLGFIGDGCAISQASVSMMIDLVKGKTVQDAKDLVTIFLDMITGKGVSDEDIEKLEDTQALAGISKMPARVKCGVLGWRTLLNELEKIEE